jgi:hypothetical protein
MDRRMIELSLLLILSSTSGQEAGACSFVGAEQVEPPASASAPAVQGKRI